MHFRLSRLFPAKFLGVIFILGLVNSGCDVPANRGGDGRGNGGNRGEGPGKRAQSVALTPEQELELGRKAYQEVLSNPQKYGRVVPVDSSESRQVRQIAAKIIRAAGIEPLQREINLRRGYRYSWEVNVLKNPEVNAFCLPGGKMCVFEGILRVAQNDDQLATVMSHEISHALAHHTSERIARADLDKQGVFGLLRGKAFDREQEAEADHIGLFLMTFAGYDPHQAVLFWERMQRAGSTQQHPPEILSDHPSDARRIQNMKVWVPRAIAAKKAYDEGNIEPAPSR